MPICYRDTKPGCRSVEGLFRQVFYDQFNKMPHIQASGRTPAQAMTQMFCFQDGKVKRLQQWMATHNSTLDGSWFYSDSHNDLPLLEQVEYPVAVDPDDKLRVLAGERGWPVTSLR